MDDDPQFPPDDLMVDFGKKPDTEGVVELFQVTLTIRGDVSAASMAKAMDEARKHVPDWFTVLRCDVEGKD